MKKRTKNILVALTLLLILPPLASFLINFYQPMNGSDGYGASYIGDYTCYMSPRWTHGDLESCTFWEKIDQIWIDIKWDTILTYTLILVVVTAYISIKVLIMLIRKHLKKMPDPVQTPLSNEKNDKGK